MATEDEGGAMRARKYLVAGSKALAVIILLPLIPLAVATNALGLADRLSPLPGITEGGGAGAGIAALVYVGGILGVATTGGLLVAGGVSPVIGDDPATAQQTPTTTPTEMTTQTKTATPGAVLTPTATQSTEERRQRELEDVKDEYLNRVRSTMENESLTGVPVIGSEYRETDDGELELWVVFWECDFAQSQDDQWITLGNDVVNAAGPHKGAQPDQVQIYAVSNLTRFEDEITNIEVSEAEEVYNESLDGGTYIENWWDRRQEPSQAENETAYQIVVEDSGQEIADTAFYVDHADNDKASCNGGAKPAEGTDDRQEHEENT